MTEDTDVAATLGVSAGSGMIHVASLAADPVGRSIIDSRVLDVDAEDGLNQAGRVNSAIDVMQVADNALTSAAICVAVRTSDESAELHRGTGRRRRIRIVDENIATVRYLSDTGLLASYESVLVIDCGDSGMTMFSTVPATGEVTDVVRTAALTGQELDRQIAQTVADRYGWSRRPTAAQVAACRTAKEDLFAADVRPSMSGQVRVSADDVASAVRPLLAEASRSVASYVAGCAHPPQLTVVVGGLAHVPNIVSGLGAAADVPAMAAPSPELAGALGAALIARDSDSAITKLATIGGRRNRDWLSTVPLVVVGVSIGVIAMSVYASGVLTSSERPFVPAVPSAPAVSDASVLTTRSTPAGDEFGPPDDATLTPEPTDTGAGPGWATTQLNPTTPARTRTLVPTTLPAGPSSGSTESPSEPVSPSTPPSSTSPSSPSLPFVPSGIPLPPNLIPPNLIPSPSPAPQPENMRPGQNAPGTTEKKPAPRSTTPRSQSQRTPPPTVVPQR